MLTEMAKTINGLFDEKTNIFEYRIPLYHPDFPFIILWSEKAGCTTVVKWFFRHINVLDDALTYSNWVHDYENSVFKREEKYVDLLKHAISKKTPIVKFVRDPYARTFSGYLELCKLQNFNKKNHWANDVRRSVMKGIAGFEADPEYGFSFFQYLKWLSEQDQSYLNSHIQNQYMDYEAKLKIRYFKMENFNYGINDLEAEYNLPLTPKWVLNKFSHSGHHFKKKNDFTKEQVLKLADMAIPVRKLGSFRPYIINKELIEDTKIGNIINSICPKDIKYYGYSIQA